jgi:glutathione reductase (NADPH)
MSEQELDLLVIGGGSGGIAAGRRAASHGARVLLCESASIGGTCVMRGCVPKKLLMLASRYGAEIADAAGFGYQVPSPTFSWPRLLAAKEAEIRRLSGIYSDLLKTAGVQVAAGRARLLDAHTVEVAGQRHRARHIVIATGARPVLPDLQGAEHGITSNEALSLPALPRRLTVVGGGYVSVELAGIFHGLGSEVQLVVREQHLLDGFDRGTTTALAEEMQKRGVRVRFGEQVQAIEKREGLLDVRLASGSRHEADVLLFAIGRAPNTHDLGLQRAGVKLGDGGAVLVDAHSTSNVPSIHAIGDCTARVSLTPVAIAEGQALADTLFSSKATAVDHHAVPSAVFGQPALAAVGLSEEKARAQGRDVRVYVKTFRPLKHALTGREDRTTMKVVVERSTDRVLGMHMVGDDAPEIIQGFAVALRCGVTKAQLDATVGIHPSAAEEFVTMRHARCGPFDD